MKNVLMLLAFLAFSGIVYGNKQANLSSKFMADCRHFHISAGSTDSVPFARVVVYRPENQLTRNYHLVTNLGNNFSLKKREVKSIDAFTNVLNIGVSATSHKSEDYTFVLSQNKVHYFRLQDRNNYSGLRPFLEIIEVTEETYKNDLKLR